MEHVGLLHMVRKRKSLGPILRQINPFNFLAFCFSTIHPPIYFWVSQVVYSPAFFGLKRILFVFVISVGTYSEIGQALLMCLKCVRSILH